jgi:hypothetical protein
MDFAQTGSPASPGRAAFVVQTASRLLVSGDPGAGQGGRQGSKRESRLASSWLLLWNERTSVDRVGAEFPARAKPGLTPLGAASPRLARSVHPALADAAAPAANGRPLERVADGSKHPRRADRSRSTRDRLHPNAATMTPSYTRALMTAFGAERPRRQRGWCGRLCEVGFRASTTSTNAPSDDRREALSEAVNDVNDVMGLDRLGEGRAPAIVGIIDCDGAAAHAPRGGTGRGELHACPPRALPHS